MVLRQLLSLSVLFSSSAFAASPVALTCNPDRETKVPEFTVRLEKNGTMTWEQFVDYRKETYSDVYSVRGRTDIEDRKSKTLEPEVVLVSQSKSDYLVNTLALVKGKPEKISGDYKNSRGSGNLDCVPGPAYAELVAVLEKAKAISKEEYYDLQDTSLAAKCRIAGSSKVAFQLRAMGDDFGRVSLQLRDKSKDFGMDDFSVLTFGADGILVFKNDKGLSIRHESETLSRLYVETASKRNREHRVVFVKDLKDPSIAPVEMMCEEAQVYSTIERYESEAKLMPKALPKKPGTRAQIDKKICGMKNYSVARARHSKWSSLIMEMKLPKGMDITGLMMGRVGKEICPSMEIRVSTRATAAHLRKIIGDSIDGLEVVFDIGEDQDSGEASAGMTF